MSFPGVANIPLSNQIPPDPRSVYSERIAIRRNEAANHFQRFRRVGFVRIAFVAVFFLLAWLVFNGLSAWWLLVPAIGFLLLGAVQQRITDQQRRCERAAEIYRQGLDRLDDRWVGKGNKGERFLDLSHPYAEDLDLFGPGSLFELISIARTRIGEETLAEWLLNPAPPDLVKSRQSAVVELRPCLDLREDLALLVEGVHTGSEARALTTWAAAGPWKISPFVKVTSRLLAVLALVGLMLWIAGYGWLPFLVFVLIGQTFLFSLRGPMLRVVRSVDAPGKDLDLLAGVLERIERDKVYESTSK